MASGIRYCKTKGIEVIWIKEDKEQAIKKFLGDVDRNESYLIKFNGVKKFENDYLGLGESVKKFDERLNKFVWFPSTYFIKIDSQRNIYFLSEYFVEGYYQIDAAIGLYYYDNKIPLPAEIRFV